MTKLTTEYVETYLSEFSGSDSNNVFGLDNEDLKDLKNAYELDTLVLIDDENEWKDYCKDNKIENKDKYFTHTDVVAVTEHKIYYLVLKKITAKFVETYLRDFKKSYSDMGNEMFMLINSDVSMLAEEYRKGEIYVYDISDWIEYCKENGFDDKIKEAKENEAVVVVDTMYDDTYYIQNDL